MHIIIYTQIDFRINTGFEAIFCLFEYILYDFKVHHMKMSKNFIVDLVILQGLMQKILNWKFQMIIFQSIILRFLNVF